MATAELISYISSHLAKGIAKDIIMQELTKAGWSKDAIGEAFSQVEKPNSSAPSVSSDSSGATKDARMYPLLEVPINPSPSRFYAIPILGILVKVIAVLPQCIFLGLYSILLFVFIIINSFIILITGHYSKFIYNRLYAWSRLYIKVLLYVYGITDKYPGFSTTINDNYKFEIAYPKSPSKFYAVPIIGVIIRSIFLIPYFIFANIVANAGGFAWFFSWGMPLVNKKYPETTHELLIDGTRMSLAIMIYACGLSDTYPSFRISKNHFVLKVIFLIIGTLLFIINLFPARSSNYSKDVQFENESQSKYIDNNKFFLPTYTP